MTGGSLLLDGQFLKLRIGQPPQKTPRRVSRPAGCLRLFTRLVSRPGYLQSPLCLQLFEQQSALEVQAVPDCPQLLPVHPLVSY